MTDFKPLSAQEHELIGKVRTLYQAQHKIPCTACRYCVDGCPAGIKIPELFTCLNQKRVFNDPNADHDYHHVHTVGAGKASDCLKCGKCEEACPQNLNIRQLLDQTMRVFEWE